MKEELKLKDIVGYFPHKLFCKVKDQGKETIAELCGIYSDKSFAFFDTVESEHGFSEVKPLLYPIDSITQEDKDYIKLNFANITGWHKIIRIKKSLSDLELSRSIIEYCVFDYLVSKMYDVNRLIPRGLALDVTKEKINPYE